jgi:PAT family beta-lactamase induction signal transducer AmpG
VTVRRKLSIVALVYFIEGFPPGIYWDLFPTYFRRQGVGLEAIGWLQALSLAWTLKVLWSPFVDRFGERRQWIVGCVLAMGSCLVAVAGLDATTLGAGLWLALAVFCIASATQDVAIDAYTIALIDRGQEGPANSVRAAAYRVGVIAAGGGLLLLPAWIGWPTTFTVAAMACLGLAAAARACPALPVPAATRRQLVGSLARWLARPGIAGAALFVLFYRVADRAMGPMVQPFWVDRGFSDAEIASVRVTIGSLATLGGAVVGGLVVARAGIPRALLALGALALASNLGYAAAAALPEAGRAGVVAASVVESACSGLATAAFLSYLMRACEKEHAAVQYALLYATSSLAGTLAAIPSGALAERFGYAAYFAGTALYAIPALALVPAAARWLATADDERADAAPA